MQEVSQLLVRLNVATRQWHTEVDEPWLALLRPDVNRPQYVGQLVRMYGFVAPFESACKYTPGLSRVLDFRQLTRAGLIAQDLLSLGLSPSQVANLPQCDSITPFFDVPEALGWLYVVERSTLLHDGIRRHLLARMPDVSNACAYLSEYDGRVSEHWTTFGRVLDRVASEAPIAGDVMTAAHAAFQRAHGWFRRMDAARHAG